MIIDSHHHIWDRRVFDYGWLQDPAMSQINQDFSMADYTAAATRHGVGGAIVVQALEHVAESLWLLETCKDETLVVGVVGWIDFTGAVGQQLDQLGAAPGGNKLVGVRFMAQGFESRDEILDPKYQEGFNAYARFGMPLDVVCRQDQISSVLKLAQWHPELTIIVDHFGKPHITDEGNQQWTELIRRVGQVPNIVVKYSGLATEADWKTWTPAQLAPVMIVALAHVPSDRLMFGSDWPVSTLAIEYGQWLDLVKESIGGLSQVQQLDVLGKTALRVYQVDAHVGVNSYKKN